MLRTKPENRIRAAFATEAIRSHQLVTGAEEDSRHSAEEILSKLLSDLRRFADAADIDFDAADKAALDRYEVESW